MPKTAGRTEREILARYLSHHRLKRSGQREKILDALLEAGQHVSVEDLLRRVHRRHPQIGRTTVYRTLTLLKEAGLASELQLAGEARFEPAGTRGHHDHLICHSCGAILEFSSPEIERLQREIARKAGFRIEGHRHTIFGLCRACASKASRPRVS